MYFDKSMRTTHMYISGIVGRVSMVDLPDWALGLWSNLAPPGGMCPISSLVFNCKHTINVFNFSKT